MILQDASLKGAATVTRLWEMMRAISQLFLAICRAY